MKFTISRDFFSPRSKKKILNSWTKTKRKMIFFPPSSSVFCRSMSRKGVQRDELTSLVKVLFSWGVRPPTILRRRQFLRKFAVPFSRQENWPLSDSFELQFSFWTTYVPLNFCKQIGLKTVYKKQRFHHLKYGQKNAWKIKDEFSSSRKWWFCNYPVCLEKFMFFK